MKFSENRYDAMHYRRCGRSGLVLPAISLGMWHNFGTHADHETCRSILHTAFEHGVTHFDLANNYGPDPGSAEERTGRILKEDFSAHRDELIISSKAGYRMWPGPYGEWGSKKYITASLDQSLARLGLDYVDIFYSHRFDPDTPLEETLEALHLAVQQGKALYVGVSNYDDTAFREAVKITQRRGWTRILIHQPCYNLMNRWIEPKLVDALEETGTGCICFSPLAQGILTNKYLNPDNPLPAASRAADPDGFLQPDKLKPDVIEHVRRLAVLADQRGQTVAQLALAWVLRDERITSALIGVRNPEQLLDSLAALDQLDFSQEELDEIDTLFPCTND